ncbi:hypothetical protein [Lentzea albidocapillata]|uniref:Uncharacterized protein n=1 Tax=Lentzea albidocapillata TaxID=40571 RepID=A0A1W2EAD6_9PSEU|nr:hypothetical protein [Lentzea albidocapillata]SMD06296.1 hypothetical protein SAMN05660733_03765 [Lentzea albidocapillata]
MRDSLLDEIAGLFSSDTPPPALTPRPTGLEPMAPVDEPVRGPSCQLVFHLGTGRLHLQLDPGHLTGVLDDSGLAVEIHSPSGVQALRPDPEGWFRATIKPGPVCVTVPGLGLTTGWFVA